MYKSCYDFLVTPQDPPVDARGDHPDPTQESRWRPLRRLLASMDDEIARVYAERGLPGVRPRYVMPLVRLHHRGAMTIRQLADELNVTHSAMSQTASALQKEGLLRAERGADGRTRELRLTDRGRELVPFLEAEWRSTEQALAELEAEVPYPLSQVVRDLEQALARRSFHDRVAEQLGADEEQA